uniref:Uncharacterized protein n=1 Tax=Heliothis virescens TaxID=7102 RepID=A0A2A4JDK3_HELVI
MSEENTEVETYFGRCRCCLSYGYLKNMWTEHKFEEGTEIYGEMLVQCFALTWNISEAAVDQDQICETCIGRLRDAHDFKKTVMDSQEELLQQIDDTDVKEEKFEVEFLDEYNDSDEDVEAGYADTEYTATTGDTMDSVKNETEYEEVEFLEDDDEESSQAVDTDTSQVTDQPTPARRKKRPGRQDPDDEAPKRKWPKKLPKSERYKTYKQYSEEDLRNCLEEVRNQELSANEAAQKYNIPMKTVCGKLREEPKGQADSYREKSYQLLKEIKAILTFTNATPYKSKNVRYYCAYCSTDGPHFEDPDDLRTHTRTAHVTHRTEKIEYAMRPYWSNEILKLDIDNLLCTVCCVVINNWNDMFKHLKQKHNVLLDQAYTRVIPYILKPDLKCALCKESFSNYLHLDGHMNAHYNNYVCVDCGDTFLAQTRLKQHAKIHNVGKYPCSKCDKIFSLQKYRRKHEQLVHEQALKFKCLHCPEKFNGEYMRYLHCLEAHKEKVKIVTCELCGQTFSWRQHYLTHMRKKHYQNSPPDLESDGQVEMVKNKQGEKKFECSVCPKKYTTLNSLKQHKKQHETEK